MVTQFEQHDDDDGDISVEDRARAMGWKPLEEFRGDPRRWTDAAEFIERGETELPILRDQNRRMSERLARFETTVAEQKAAVDAALNLAKRADNAGYERAMAELKARQREAVEVGDVTTFDQIDEQIKAAETERAKDTTFVTVPIKPAEPLAPIVPQVDAETLAFTAANPWFNSRPILRQAMIAAHLEIVKMEGPAKGQALTDQYERAKADVVESFPQFFSNQGDPAGADLAPAPRPRLRAPALSPSTNVQQPRRGTSPFARITNDAERAEAQVAFASIQKQQPGVTAEEYIAIYFGEGDPIELANARRKGK